ncbi:hypothetical protein [Jongsikchunia kroppenstedtii]|uniref:hypothetical protein n=1 Tax=Jongsikchunia kroppenstedtii TaxID=1121721 RepID=UPI0012DCC6CE|nr:hypothetical protein [Jongsikchunia kroppenstedtii]
MATGTKRMGFALVLVLLVLGFIDAMSICIMPAIWPGELKLTAPVFCSKSELGGSYTPYAVTDTYSTGDGTAFNWTLYCVGPHGETKNAGYGLPIGMIFLAHGVILLALLAAVALWRRTRTLDLSRLRRRRSPQPKPQRYFVFDNRPKDDAPTGEP